MSVMKTIFRGAVVITAALLVCAMALFSPTVAVAAEDSSSPDHVLTYTTGELVWDEQTEVRADGTARMDLFSETHHNVASSNGERVFAPGTEMSNITRLKNESDSAIHYVVVMYRIKNEPNLPIEPELLGSGFEDTTDYPLPDGVREDHVVRAVTGAVEPGDVQDFSIAWLWNYYDSYERDAMDTDLGNTAAYFEADDVTAGLYIVVEDDSNGTTTSYIYPSLPKTGDDIALTVGALLATAMLSLLLMGVAKGWKARKCKEL